MHCSVFRSRRRDYTYIYLKQGKSFEDIPEALASVFGEPEFVIDLELSPGRELAQEDVETVMNNLDAHGFHLQMPPGDDRGDLL